MYSRYLTILRMNHYQVLELIMGPKCNISDGFLGVVIMWLGLLCFLAVNGHHITLILLRAVTV